MGSEETAVYEPRRPLLLCHYTAMITHMLCPEPGLYPHLWPVFHINLAILVGTILLVGLTCHYKWLNIVWSVSFYSFNFTWALVICVTTGELNRYSLVIRMLTNDCSLVLGKPPENSLYLLIYFVPAHIVWMEIIALMGIPTEQKGVYNYIDLPYILFRAFVLRRSCRETWRQFREFHNDLIHSDKLSLDRAIKRPSSMVKTAMQGGTHNAYSEPLPLCNKASIVLDQVPESSLIQVP